MEDQNLHYRHIMLFYLKQGKNASQKCAIKCILCTGKIQFLYVCAKRRFVNFRSGVLLVKDWSGPGWPTEINTDEIKVLVDENPKIT